MYRYSISQFLDRNMYLTSNEAYTDRPQDSAANQAGGGSAGAGIYVPPTYEAVGDPSSAPRTGDTSAQRYEVLEPTPGEPRHGPSTSQVTADIVAQHYEMSDANTPSQSRDYEVPMNEGANSQPAGGINHDYSRLQHQ